MRIWRTVLFNALLLQALLGVAACKDKKAKPHKAPEPVATSSSPPAVTAPRVISSAPKTLYLPDASAPLAVAEGVASRSVRRSPCPEEMVSINGEFCIDRYEVSLVELKKGRPVSPYYHPSFTHTRSAFKVWEIERKNMGDEPFRLLPIPEPPAFQLQGRFEVKAESRAGVTPNGYLNGIVAENACTAAGKRLCTEEEWVQACKGEAGTPFPYGDEYQAGKCNVFNGKHPAKILHGNASIGHLDPRLNQFSYEGQALLHKTGSDPECRSKWGQDAVYDMVGNLDEWVQDEDGRFLGGFYARNTKHGCEAKISSHPRAYFDYSLGTRCCK